MNPKRRKIIELSKPKFILADPNNPVQYRTKPTATPARAKALQSVSKADDDSINRILRRESGAMISESERKAFEQLSHGQRADHEEMLRREQMKNKDERNEIDQDIDDGKLSGNTLIQMIKRRRELDEEA